MNPYLLINLKQNYWPAAPVDVSYNSLHNLMQKLPYKLRIICALEAGKMALPIWEKYALTILVGEQKAPRRAIETIEKWLDGKATIEEVEEATNNARDAAANSISHAASYAANAASYIKHNSSDSVSSACDAVAYDAILYKNKDMVRLKFYKEWWSRCYLLIGNVFHDILNKYINGEL